ncbi:decapping enzyme complex catalytic subunit KNAG_0I02110 [Huiozyma naganishii CBS 8797]|uniref:Nudix hydrolase domain-containing protein n=1 Tax=Huiozyma naganishii (strain ATCC MYA-139 / BCRC 22969 / CBS 8797 / KCTC 17520 / NBRC 10181 / NCYC 3082 / Yp74L-3) TaxID=1071383 RepID=J7SAA8_HUIN7|nr:hypothetical protein KNAG_0I02110 [Kazachstania naganishii CBS 8797]CCK71996.1 hypothetical protein KNAG_0I02110 [Kazachstania naganishii CBS 8797]
MSLPLRPGLENITSLDRVLEDLLVRFIINCPPEDLSSVERELFHFEEASWFYTDFVRIMNPNLPSMKIKSLSQLFIKLCPLIWKWDIKADEALVKFSKYKKTIPVRGAALFNADLNKMLLVKGTESDSWSFPRGKISKDEDDVDCCIREVDEEIGFDLTTYIDADQFVERTISGKNYKIYIIKAVPEDFPFKPKVRNEIDKIQWFDFKKVTKMVNKSHGGNQYKFYLINSMIRSLSIWVRQQRQIKNDDQLKQFAEEQLKLLLGINKKAEIDPGRDLLNMLHSAVQSNGNTDQTINPSEQQNTSIKAPATASPPDSAEQSNTPLYNNTVIGQYPAGQYPPIFPQAQQSTIRAMGFQPFAPFPFSNGVLPTAVPQMFMMNPPIALQQQASVNSTFPPPKLTTVPSTPNVSSLSKPSLAVSGQNQNSKELLSLLTQKSKPTSAEKESQRNDSADLKDKLSNDSRVLLSILHSKATEQNYSTDNSPQATAHFPEKNSPPQHQPEPLLAPQHTSEPVSNDNIDNYEDFEVGSSDEEDEVEEEQVAKESPSYTSALPQSSHYTTPADNYSNFEDSSGSSSDFESATDGNGGMSESDIEEVELEALNQNNLNDPIISKDILKENAFKNGEVPHNDHISESVRSINGSKLHSTNVSPQPAAPTSLPKPKFKLLKRGEKLDDVIKPKTAFPASQDNITVDEEAIIDEDKVDTTNNELLNMLRRHSEKKGEAPSASHPTTTSNNELLNIIKGNHPAPQSEKDSGHTLLDMLKNPTKSERPSTGQQYSQSSESGELLSLLKGPSKDRAPYHTSTPFQSVNDTTRLPTEGLSSSFESVEASIPGQDLFGVLGNKPAVPTATSMDASAINGMTSRFSNNLSSRASVQSTQSGATDLLNLLKKPTSQSSAEKTDKSASNELLNILHGK